MSLRSHRPILNMGVYQMLGLVKVTLSDAWRVFTSRQGIKSLYAVSLYRNAAYLLMSTVAGAFLGSIFWLLVARLYSPSDIGLASALVSASLLLSHIASLGLGYGLIRFLPGSKDKAQLLNAIFTLVAVTSVIASLIFLAGLPWWSPKLMFVREIPAFSLAVILFVTATSVYGIASSAFVALRRAGFVLPQALILNLLRLGLAAVFVPFFQVFGIFGSIGVAYGVALAISAFYFLPRALPYYRPIPVFRWSAGPNPRVATNSKRFAGTKEVARFSFAIYVHDGLVNLPTWLLPLMIVALLTPEANAYFFISWSIAGLLWAIPSATTVSLWAEGSAEEKTLNIDLKRSLKLIVLLLLPATAVLMLLAGKLLRLFGGEYAAEGTRLLYLLAPAALPLSIRGLYVAVAAVEKRLKSIVMTAAALAFGTLSLSYLLLPHLGILAPGVAWLAAQTGVALIVLPGLLRRLRAH